MSSEKEINTTNSQNFIQESLFLPESSLSNNIINSYVLRKQFSRIIPNCYMSLPLLKEKSRNVSDLNKFQLYLRLKNEVSSMKKNISSLEKSREEKLIQIENLREIMKDNKINKFDYSNNRQKEKKISRRNNKGNLGQKNSEENERSFGSTEGGISGRSGKNDSGCSNSSCCSDLGGNNDDSDYILQIKEN